MTMIKQYQRSIQKQISLGLVRVKDGVGTKHDTAKNNLLWSSKRVNRTYLISIAVAMMTLNGCTDRVGLASDKLAAIRQEPAQEIEKPPQPVLVEDYVYDAQDVRSPFMPPSLLNRQQQAMVTTGVTPDLNRVKGPLESYALSELTYRGKVTSPDGDEFALVQRPDGTVDSVMVGDYLGKQDGQIVEITPTQINLIEIVSDNRAGFVEKPAALVSPI